MACNTDIQQVIANELSLNGTILSRRGDTIFIPLPRGLWRESGDPGCICKYCSADPNKSDGSPSYWDTLAVKANAPKQGNDYSWTVHRPDLHGARPKREE